MIWNISPEIGTFFGITLRWYSILFATGLFLAGWYVYVQFKKMGYMQSQFESLLLYLFFGIFVGARLAHCLFYEPQYYLAHPIEMLLPITILPDGGWQFTGYHGLASHGGGVGVALALWLFCRQYKAPFLPLADVLAIATPLAGASIRLGNLFNSEIVGAPSHLPWAVVFPLYDNVPRHPAQIYEALFYLTLFAALWFCRQQRGNRLPAGFFLGATALIIGIFRFCIEFIKAVQVPFEQGMNLNMGQWLSVPLIVVGIAVLVCISKHNTTTQSDK